MISDLVAHDLHDIVTIGDEAERNNQREDGKLPDGDRSLRLSGAASAPSTVDNSPGTDRVTDIVSTVCKGSSASSENLDERVCVLDLVGILLRRVVHTLHTFALGGSVDTGLGGVDVVVETVESTADDHSGNTLDKEDLNIRELVDLTGADGVLVECAHSPAERSPLPPQPRVELLLCGCHQLLVVVLLGFDIGEALLVDGMGLVSRRQRTITLDNVDLIDGVRRTGGGVLLVVLVLDNGVVGHIDTISVSRRRTLEQERSLDKHIPLDGMIAVDDPGVDERDEEECRKKCNTTTCTHGDTGNVPWGLLVEAKVGGSLVDNGQCADGSGDEEPQG